MAAIGIVTEWLQGSLEVEGISLNRKKSQALLANRVLPKDLTEEQRLAMDSIGLTFALDKRDESRMSTGGDRTVQTGFREGDS